jgi:hypothetical protein
MALKLAEEQVEREENKKKEDQSINRMNLLEKSYKTVETRTGTP